MPEPSRATRKTVRKIWETFSYKGREAKNMERAKEEGGLNWCLWHANHSREGDGWVSKEELWLKLGVE